MITIHVGGNQCTLTAVASLNNNEQDKLALQLQCGSIICPSQPKPLGVCDNIHDQLAIGM